VWRILRHQAGKNRQSWLRASRIVNKHYYFKTSPTENSYNAFTTLCLELSSNYESRETCRRSKSFFADTLISSLR
jgi:hypothetical protein